MISERRGLSDIVTNVLIILLVLVAVGIMWAFLNPFLRSSAGSTANAAGCYKIQLTTRCDYYSSNAPGVTNNWVFAKADRASGKGDLAGLQYIFTKADGNTIVLNFNDSFDVKSGHQVWSFTPVPNELESSRATFTNFPMTPNTMTVASLIGIDKKTCPADTVICQKKCLADINFDGRVDGTDLNLYHSCVDGTGIGPINCDLNKDGLNDTSTSAFDSAYNAGC